LQRENSQCPRFEVDASLNLQSKLACLQRSDGEGQNTTLPTQKFTRSWALLLDGGVREGTDDGRLDLPDLAGVLADGAVGGELAHARDVEQRLAVPGRAILVLDVDPQLSLDIVMEVGEVHVLVARAEELGHDRAEDVLVASREMSRRDRVDHPIRF